MLIPPYDADDTLLTTSFLPCIIPFIFCCLSCVLAVYVLCLLRNGVVGASVFFFLPYSAMAMFPILLFFLRPFRVTKPEE